MTSHVTSLFFLLLLLFANLRRSATTSSSSVASNKLCRPVHSSQTADGVQPSLKLVSPKSSPTFAPIFSGQGWTCTTPPSQRGPSPSQAGASPSRGGSAPTQREVGGSAVTSLSDSVDVSGEAERRGLLEDSDHVISTDVIDKIFGELDC